jgi:hypothetical protein
MEAEYQALSASYQDLIPLHHIIQEASTALHIGKGSADRSFSKVYDDEDKSACLCLPSKDTNDESSY